MKSIIGHMLGTGVGGIIGVLWAIAGHILETVVGGIIGVSGAGAWGILAASGEI